FEQFTSKQLAGDLLPHPTPEQLVATGFNRLNMVTREGGAQAKEYLAKYAADRVRTVSTAWLASTMGCCECHDHKFDPFSTKDFYSLAAFFADIKETPVGKREQGMLVPNDAQAAEIKNFDDSISAAKTKLDITTPELAAAQSKWEESLKDFALPEWSILTPIDAASANGVTLKIEKDHSILASGKSPDKDIYFVTTRTKLKNITAFRLEVLPHQ